MHKLFASLFLLLISLAYSQPASQAVNQTAFPPPSPVVGQNFYDGNGNLLYTCTAAQVQPTPSTFSIADSTLTSIAVSGGAGTITFSSTSYLWVGAQITIGNSTTAGLNGTYKVTAVSGSTATITTSGVSNGTYNANNNAFLTIQTYNPLLNQAAWAIAINVFNSSNQLTGYYYAGAIQGGIQQAFAPIPQNLPCSSRTSY